MAAVRGRGITSFGAFLDPLSISGGVTFVVTPARRILKPLREDRLLEVDPDDRYMDIGRDQRSFTPEGD